MDAAADGYVRAETCKAIYLMPATMHGMTAHLLSFAYSQLGMDASHEPVTDVAVCISKARFDYADVMRVDGKCHQNLHLHDWCTASSCT